MPRREAILPLPKMRSIVAGGQRELEHVGVSGDDLEGDVDLLELHLRRPGLDGARRDVDRPELRADHALAEALDVGVAGGPLPRRS
jgi:hypothetical protein